MEHFGNIASYTIWKEFLEKGQETLNPETIISKCKQLLAKTETKKHVDDDVYETDEEWEEAEEGWTSDDATLLDQIPIIPLPQERKSTVPAHITRGGFICLPFLLPFPL